MKKKHFLIVGLISIMVVGVGILTFTAKKQIAKGAIDTNGEEIVLKESKYTAEEMLAFFKGESSPDDMEAYYDIILNWYDYYSKDTPFINRLGDVYTYEEYMKIKEVRSEYTVKMSLPVISRIYFSTDLTDE